MPIIPDKYNIAELVEGIKAKHIPDMTQNALLMSTLGAIGELFTNQINMDITAISEVSNEAFAIKAKFDRDILAHAVQANVKNLYATPAYMDIRIGITEKVLDANITNGSNTFVIDKKTPIFIEDYEFHLDYDIIITRSKPYNYNTDGYVYIAQYDMSEPNKLSNIESPYLSPPAKTNINGDDFILIYCRIRQVEHSEIPRKITTDDTIENKTFEFEFESQLAYFDLVVTDPAGKVTVLNPLLEGSAITDNSKNYFYYTHMDSNTIRVKFISSYYNPSLNSNIAVRLYTTQGRSGNFTYNKSFLVSPSSDRFRYNGVVLYIIPCTDSDYGANMKSMEDLKREIPMKILARESLTSEQDLQNYFNVLNDEYNVLKFVKQVHNQNETRFFSYLLMKNMMGNVVPTNTVDTRFSNSFMKGCGDTIKPGTLIHYNSNMEFAEVFSEEMDREDYNQFYYSTPFLIRVTRVPILHLSYYLNIIDISYQTDFTFINKTAFLQFICTTVNIKREFLTDRNIYKLRTTITQNIDEDFELVSTDTNGNITDASKLKAFYIFYDQFNNPVKYKMCDVIAYDKGLQEYTLEAQLETEDEFDVNGKFINITNLNDFKAYTTSDTYLPRQTKVVLYVTYHIGAKTTNADRDDADTFVPDLDGYVLSNKYTIDPGIELYVNFSEIVNSVVRVSRKDNEEMNFHILSMPLVQYDYMQNEENVIGIIDNFVTRKLYIDETLTVLQDPLGINMKLFNTYGPSTTFRVGHENHELNRINITLRLRMKLDVLAQDNLKDVIITEIKSYMENLNESNDFHYSSLDQYLRNKYPSISWIEFLGINDYGTDNQYIRHDPNIEHQVPEFININTIDDKPDIQVIIA